jgi:restriction system protein
MGRKPKHAGDLEGAQFVVWMPRVLDCLRALGDSANSSEVIDWLGKTFEVSEEERARVNKYKVRHFDNKVAWAKQYLTWEGFIDASKRGIWTLTTKGKATALSHEESLAIYRKVAAENRARKAAAIGDEKPDKGRQKEESEGDNEATAPAIEEGAGDELIDVLLALTPNGFERICMRMMRESGFEKVEVTGKSHDRGIDGIGILLVNRFVTIKVFFQCKRYQGMVSASHVRDFRGAMAGRADKGLFITTGRFTSEAIREASRDGVEPIELVDGEKLVKIFEDLELGVKPKTVYEVDHSFFEPFKTDGPKLEK